MDVWLVVDVSWEAVPPSQSIIYGRWMSLSSLKPSAMTGWWLTYFSEKYEFVSWDDEIPNFSGKI